MSMKRFLIAFAILSLAAGTALASPAGKTGFRDWKAATFHNWKATGLKLKRVKLSSTAWLYMLISLTGQKFMVVISNKGHAILLTGSCHFGPDRPPFVYQIHNKPSPGDSTLGVVTGRHGAVIDISVTSANGTVSSRWSLHDERRLCDDGQT